MTVSATPQRSRVAGLVEYGELPEFARALRAMGSSRKSAGERQSQFFFALIDARRRAAAGPDADARVRAFDTVELGRALDRVIDKLVSDWPDKRSSARRALRAEVGGRVEPYSVSLRALALRADDVSSAGGADATDATRLAAWRAWTVQLSVVFEAADRSWMALRSVVDRLQGTRR